MAERTPRTYYGVTIRPMKMNPMGCRWYADEAGVGLLQSDTIEGMKRLIRAKKGR